MKANFWVIAVGRDCDGYNSGRVEPFADKEEAINFANEMNDWSDGIGYLVISNIWDVKVYCESYGKGKDWANYGWVLPK